MLPMVPKPGALADLVQLFKDEEIFERAQATEGCIDVMMLQQPDQVIVIGFWEDEDAYQRWVDHPERGNGNADINALLAEPISTDVVGGMFDVALATTTLGMGQL